MARRRGVADAEPGDRVCARCGRLMPAGASPEARWCSAACRRRKLTAIDGRLEDVMRARLAALSRGSTLCPSEIARRVAANDPSLGDDGWRDLMEPSRQAARRLVASGEAEITQGGRVVDPSTARGPIRVRPVR